MALNMETKAFWIMQYMMAICLRRLMTRILTIIGLLFATPAWAEIDLETREKMLIRCVITWTESRVEKYGIGGYSEDKIFKNCRQVTKELGCLDSVLCPIGSGSSCHEELLKKCQK